MVDNKDYTLHMFPLFLGGDFDVQDQLNWHQTQAAQTLQNPEIVAYYGKYIHWLP